MKKIIKLLLILVMILCLTAADKAGFKRGKTGKNYYENQQINIRCDFPASFVLKSEKEIDRIISEGVDSRTKDKKEAQKQKKLMKETILYEVYAVNDENGSSVSILAEKPTNPKMNLDEYINGSVVQIILSDNFQKISTGREMFCGKATDKMEYTLIEDEGPRYTKEYFMQVEDRFVVFTFSAWDEDVLKEMEGYCRPYGQ